MVNNLGISLSTFVATRSDAARHHREAFGEAWEIGDEFLNLHVSALRAISERTNGVEASESDMTVVRLACHGLNLYVSALELTFSGKFDVALLLLRAMFDCGPLVFAVAKDDDTARSFNEEKLTAADARKLQRDYIRQFDSSLADGLDTQWEGDLKALNKASHVQALHAEKLIHVNNGRVTPWIGGREDLDECRPFLEAAHQGEFWHLSSLSNFRLDTLGTEWREKFKVAGQRYAAWRRKNRESLIRSL